MNVPTPRARNNYRRIDDAGAERAQTQRRGRVWAGLVALCLGLALLDRAFASWRNDPRTEPGLRGPLTAEQTRLIPHGPLGNRSVRETMAAAGVALLVASVALFPKIEPRG